MTDDASEMTETTTSMPPKLAHARPAGMGRWAVMGLVIAILGAGGVIASVGGIEPLSDLISPALVEVTGRVNFNGKPVTTGYVQTFYDRQGWMGGMGEIKPDGTFRLMTNGDPGAFSGKHRVVVMWMTNTFPPKHILPEVYTQKHTTPLVIQVSRSNSNDFQLDLVDPESL